jgi:GntR family transcriptional regulator
MPSRALSQMISLDLSRVTPLYLQIARAIEAQIVAGRLKPGDRLPTVRELAVDLNVTTSVIQRAMAELNSLGLVIGQGTAGTFVSSRLEHGSTLKERTWRYARQTIDEIDRLGYDRKTIARLIDPKGTDHAD